MIPWHNARLEQVDITFELTHGVVPDSAFSPQRQYGIAFCLCQFPPYFLLFYSLEFLGSSPRYFEWCQLELSSERKKPIVVVAAHSMDHCRIRTERFL